MFVAETVLTVFLIATPPLRKAEDLMLNFDSTGGSYVQISNSEEKRVQVEPQGVDTMDQVLAKDFGAVQQVKYVFTEKLPDAFLVWIAVDNPIPKVRRQIYDKEFGVISEFPTINFDFNLVSSLGRPSEEISSSSTLIYSRLTE